MPSPLSRTRITAQEMRIFFFSAFLLSVVEMKGVLISASSRSMLKEMWPPAGVYLAALWSRLDTTCTNRVGSPST